MPDADFIKIDNTCLCDCRKGFLSCIDGKPKYFNNLAKDEQDLISNTKLTIYVCEGTLLEIEAQ